MKKAVPQFSLFPLLLLYAGTLHHVIERFCHVSGMWECSMAQSIKDFSSMISVSEILL